MTKEQFEITICRNCPLPKCVNVASAGCNIQGERFEKIKNIYKLINKYKVIELQKHNTPPAETVEILNFLASSKLVEKTKIGFHSL